MTRKTIATYCYQGELWHRALVGARAIERAGGTLKPGWNLGGNA
jgi:hypothetical protein